MKANLIILITVVSIFLYTSCSLTNSKQIQLTMINNIDSLNKIIDSIHNDYALYISKTEDVIYELKRINKNLEVKYFNDSIYYTTVIDFLESEIDTLETIILIKSKQTEQFSDIKKKRKKTANIIGSKNNKNEVQEKNENYTVDRVSFRENEFDFIKIKTDKQTVNFFFKDSFYHNYSSLGHLVTKKKSEGRRIFFATNGGMYKPDKSPQGLYVENGKVIEPVNLNTGEGNFYMNFGKDPLSNGIFFLDENRKAKIFKSGRFAAYKDKIYNATQSGPILLYNGEINPNFNEGSANLNIRSGVGIISPSEIVFVISNKPVNFYDFALFIKKQFGCDDALYLDGAVSQMYLPELKRYQTGGNFGCMIGCYE